MDALEAQTSAERLPNVETFQAAGASFEELTISDESAAIKNSSDTKCGRQLLDREEICGSLESCEETKVKLSSDLESTVEHDALGEINRHLASALTSELQSQMQLRLCIEAERDWMAACQATNQIAACVVTDGGLMMSKFDTDDVDSEPLAHKLVLECAVSSDLQEPMTSSAACLLPGNTAGIEGGCESEDKADNRFDYFQLVTDEEGAEVETTDDGATNMLQERVIDRSQHDELLSSDDVVTMVESDRQHNVNTEEAATITFSDDVENISGSEDIESDGQTASDRTLDFLSKVVTGDATEFLVSLEHSDSDHSSNDSMDPIGPHIVSDVDTVVTGDDKSEAIYKTEHVEVVFIAEGEESMPIEQAVSLDSSSSNDDLHEITNTTDTATCYNLVSTLDTNGQEESYNAYEAQLTTDTKDGDLRSLEIDNENIHLNETENAYTEGHNHHLEESAIESVVEPLLPPEPSRSTDITSHPTIIVPWLMPRSLEESNKMLRDERSQRMMLEQLNNITQQECNGLRAFLARETTTRMKLETQVADLKVELKSSQKEAEEAHERIRELEGSLQGTMVLVKKLEEQSSTSLLSRGGIDYMLEAKLATNRALEAEQKHMMLQSELLQSQGEVKRLLDSLTELRQERSEMVSGRVHNELMKIADDKARAAEAKVAEMQHEIDELKAKVSENSSLYDQMRAKSAFDVTPSDGLSYPSSLSYLPRVTSSYSSSLTGFSSSSFTAFPSVSYPSIYSGSNSLLFQPLTSESVKPTSGVPFSSYKSDFYNSDARMATSMATEEKPSDMKENKMFGREETASRARQREQSKPPPLSPKPVRKRVSFQDPPATKSNDNAHEVELPLLSSSLPDVEPSYGDISKPPPTEFTPAVNKGHSSNEDDSDASSDWSSDEDSMLVAAGPPAVDPHTNLVAKWEWRATHGMEFENAGPSKMSPSQERKTIELKQSPKQERRPPTQEQELKDKAALPSVSSPIKSHRPPIAPKPTVKPKALFHAFQRSRSSEIMLMENGISFEDDPNSFLRVPSLTRNFSRPRGPANRKRPSRFVNK